VATQAPTPPPLPSGRVARDLSSDGGDLASDLLGLLVSVPADAMAGLPATLVLEPSTIGSLPPPLGGAVLGERAFTLELSSAAAALPAPLRLSYRPTASELALATGDAGRLRLGMWTGTAWSPLACAVDRTAPLLLCAASQPGQFALLIAPASAPALELELGNGRFYSQANGFSGAGATGFSVVDDDAAAFWSEFQRLGGVARLGYPVTGRFQYGGFLTQVFQRAALQWQPALAGVVRINVLDDLSRRGSDAWMQRTYQVPRAPGLGDDPALPWDDVFSQHMSLLDTYPALHAFYDADPDGLDRYGLPISVQDYGPLVVVRTQRALIQLWTIDQAWGPAGTVIAGNAGDLAKEAGLWPLNALAPELPPAAVRYPASWLPGGDWAELP
jgi:hypothetical protein